MGFKPTRAETIRSNALTTRPRLYMEFIVIFSNSKLYTNVLIILVWYWLKINESFYIFYPLSKYSLK